MNPLELRCRVTITKLDMGQSEIALAFQQTRQDLRAVVDKVAHLESRQDQSLHRTRDIEVRLQEMEKELRDLRSRSPSVAPTTPRGQGTPRARDQTRDTWQLVVEAGLMPEGLTWRMKFVHGFLRSSVHLCLKTFMGLRFGGSTFG